jgi:hypothetical protein
LKIGRWNWDIQDAFWKLASDCRMPFDFMKKVITS